MPKQIFKTAAIVSKIMSMNDGGWRISLDTNELAEDVAVKLMALNKKFCAIALAPEDSKIEDAELEIPDEQKEFPNQKSPSERLFKALFKLWNLRGKQGDFEDYRRRYMEKFIESVKAKINENQI